MLPELQCLFSHSIISFFSYKLHGDTSMKLPIISIELYELAEGANDECVCNVVNYHEEQKRTTQ
jgi:hypothetical protein